MTKEQKMVKTKAFFKCLDTVFSCKTVDQLEVARRMCWFYDKKYGDMNLDIRIALLMKEALLKH